METLRSLVLANVAPWPALDGYRLRLAHMIGALATAGPVDVFCSEPALADPGVPPPVPVRLVRTTPRPRPPLARAVRWLTGSTPRSLDTWEVDAAVERFRREAGDYDVVLYSHVSAWLLFSGITDAPAIVDLDNLDSLALRARSTVDGGANPAGGAAARARAVVDRVDAGRMARLEQRCADHVTAVTLCSRLDLERSGFANGHVIANGSDRLADPPDRSGRGTAGELFFVGQLGYEPNRDAVRWFAREILPLVRGEVPAARFRVIGHSPDAVADVADLDGVDVVGPVADLQVELDRADVAVIPIRFGSGTRLKVVEALANRLAVVTTTVGSEGIDVVDGQSALVADDPAAFAAACIRALREPALRAELGAAGEALWEAEYRWSTIQDQLVELARAVAAGH